MHSDAILSPYRAVLGSCGIRRARSTGVYCFASHPRAPLREKSALAGQATTKGHDTRWSGSTPPKMDGPRECAPAPHRWGR
ncbi:hypothetical protein HOT42_gp57 [Microbacterium phage Metamorphoo]|uniref:Uncharacterized protein n=1 Tax=Microbacterium phage Metamorphoo TaxID=2201437 RepID=A0A2Z4Q7H7_9CAUD|nr:hypothetical protein HOT42_gp57 [Microbacterium phage Metamorphoo]AWY05443.1 hypothetical protein SEA_METAMORPHOO_57 [Microbacterium phage Metamorphoo]